MALFLKLDCGCLKGTKKLSHYVNDALERLIRDIQIPQLAFIWSAESVGLAEASEGIETVRRVDFRMCFVLTFVRNRVPQVLDIGKAFV